MIIMAKGWFAGEEKQGKCVLCGKDSYYDEKEKVFVHTICKNKFMKEQAAIAQDIN